MATVVQKYLNLVSGLYTQLTFTYLGGVGHENKPVQTDENGYLDPTILPPGLGPELVTCVTSENIAAGDYVNLYSNAGVLTARKADASAASAGKIAHGFVLAATVSPAVANVYRLGKNGQVSGKTVAAQQWLSGVTPGGTVEAAPSTSGYSVQSLGIAISATNIDTQIEPPVVLA